MKKILGLLIASNILCGMSYAEGIDSMKYKKINSGNSDNLTEATLAVNKDTKEIIPFSMTEYYDYLFAYDKNKGEIEEVTKEGGIFWDIDEWDFQVKEFSARGVLCGYEDGSMREENILTRAEMATILVRLFSIDTLDVKDTEATDWYTKYVTALYNYGVLEENDNFYPNKGVTREELITLTYKILKKEELIKDKEDFDFSEYFDIDKVSDDSKLAYKTMYSNGYRSLENYEEIMLENGEIEFKYLLKPQREITRADTFMFLYSVMRNCISENAPAIKKEDAPNIEIPIIDGSTSTYPITKSLYDMYYYNSHNLEEMPKQHSKTTNAYKRLIDKEVEMIFVPDASAEVLKYANDKDIKLKFIPIAKEALVFFTGKDNKINNISTDDLYRIYVNNSIKNWKDIGGEDKGLVAYCRNKDSGSHAQMEKFILNGGNINDDIYKERISLVMSTILSDVASYNEENKDSIALGYSLYYYYNTVQMVQGEQNLKLLPINGIKPTNETIASSEYPYTTNYYAVVRDEENDKVDKFIELLKGEFGRQIVQNSGIGG